MFLLYTAAFVHNTQAKIVSWFQVYICVSAHTQGCVIIIDMYILLSNKFQVFVHCDKDIIVDHSLEVKDDGEWFVYCLTKKGDLYRVGNDQAEQCARYVALPPDRNKKS